MCQTSEFTVSSLMVAMEDGKPKAIPLYVPETGDEKQRDQAAKIRRAFKDEYLEKLKKPLFPDSVSFEQGGEVLLTLYARF